MDFLLALLCAASLIALQNVSFMQRAEWFAFDKLTRWTAASRPLDPTLAVVAIDDYSINRLASPTTNSWAWAWAWPWPRGAYADMIAYLKASGAREIWIDLIFYTPDPDGFRDAELKAVAAAAGNVHFGQGEKKAGISLFQPTFNVELPSENGQNLVIHGDVNGQRLLAWPQPFEILRDSKQLGKDSPITSAAFVVNEGEKLLKSLPVDDLTNPEKIAALWTNGAVPPFGEHFQNKIVYVGVSASSGYDLKAFPVGPQEPSVMLHVVTRSNELEDGFFREIPDGLRCLLVLACCLVTSDLFRRLPNFHRYTACMLAFTGVIAGISYLLFEERIWVRPVLYPLAVALTFTVVTATNYVREGRKRRMTEDLFGKFVSRKIVDRLVARPDQLRLGGEKAELTVLFSDLSGFTTLSEQMTSDVLLTMLNTYLNEMSELIYEREGTLDKYIGDAIMAFWGAPDASPDHAWQACHAALACQQRLAELAPKWEETYKAKLVARIGINTDEMTVGLVGSNRLHNYSVIGDAVNLASRLEGANKPFGTSIMIAQRTVDLAQGKIEVRPLARLQVKGKTNYVTVYELLARAGELSESRRAAQQTFTEAFDAFLNRDWNKAESLLQQLLLNEPDDKLAAKYLERVREYAVAPPGPEWVGVFKLDEK
jgi:adenylate cyclase